MMNLQSSMRFLGIVLVCLIFIDLLPAHFVGRASDEARVPIGQNDSEEENGQLKGDLHSRTKEKTMSKVTPNFPPLPEGLSSFGGAVHDGWLYVYGGHTGGAHDHSRENLAPRFQRLKLEGGKIWEELPMQTPSQGLALVAHQTGIYRIGGLNARNAPDDDEDLHSLADFSRFDPQSGQWTQLTDLPQSRSSHDAVVIGNQLYVAGGWTLVGEGDGTWLNTGLVIDLTDPDRGWKPLPQAPFERRALAVSHWHGKLVVAGGIDSAGDISFSMDLYDPTTKIWSTGPRLPGEGMNAFGLSAWNLEEELYLCGFGGIVYKLSADGMRWNEVLAMQTARFFHQLLPGDSRSLLAVAGASMHGHLKDVEWLQVLKPIDRSGKTTVHPPKQPDKGVGPETPSLPLKDPIPAQPPNNKASKISANSWPGFRGGGNSVSYATDLPLHWNDEQGMSWSVDLPGYGQSSPIVWQSQVFVTTMQGTHKETPTILCFDISTGQEQWRREYESSQQVAVSNYVTRCAPTPVVDSQGVYAFFESGELVSLDHEGNLRWQRSLVTEYGPFQGNHGVGSSLAATRNGVIALVNHDGPSYLMAVGKQDGMNLWKVDYDKRVAWSSPIVAEYGDQQVVVVSAHGHVDAYQADSGKVLWKMEGLSGNNVPSATVVGDVVYVGSKDTSSNVAVQWHAAVAGSSDEAFDPNTTEILWRSKKQTCSFSSPLCHRGFVYSVNRAGVAYCTDAQSGEIAWQERLGDSCWASPVGAGDRIYFFTKSGKSKVVSHGSTYELLAENEISIQPKTRVYGVAVVQGKLLLRTGNRLICLSN